jgi:hypothetical protein
VPRLLAMAGREDEAGAALREIDLFSWDADPWLVLETAWRDLPAPTADEIRVGHGDYGAVRGFFHPRGRGVEHAGARHTWSLYERGIGPMPPAGPHRWTRAHAWLRLVPTRPAAGHEVTLAMGAPFPSTLDSPEVSVTIGGTAPVRLRLGRDVAEYRLAARTPPGQPLVVRIDAPTWCRAGEPAEQGVRVDRLAVSPLP